MEDNSTSKRHLKVVPAPAPNSLISDDPFSLLPRSSSGEGICWSRTPVRPYLAVIQGGDFAPEMEPSTTANRIGCKKTNLTALANT